MKADTINLYMDSIVNGKRVGDMTYDELHELAKKWIQVQGKCRHLVLLRKEGKEEKVVFGFSLRDLMNEQL